MAQDTKTCTVIDNDVYAIDRTIETANAEGGGTVVFMIAANVPTTDPDQHARVAKGLLEKSADQKLLDGLEVLLDQQGCRLVRKPLTGREFINNDTVLTMDGPQTRQDCYAAAITYAMNNLDEFGPRTPFDQQVD